MSHLLEYIDIKDFKCFKNFHAEGFKRVNLIGGKNNVGKTAFLESFYINTHSTSIKKLIHTFTGIKFRRENLNALAGDFNITKKERIEILNHLDIKSNIYYSKFNIIDENDGIKLYNFEFNKQHIKINVNDFSFEEEFTSNIHFIDNFGFSNAELIECYSSIQKKDKEEYLNNILNKFDEKIESFKVIDDIPQCKLNGYSKNEGYLEITEFGDGLRHLISIVTALFASENGYLFIDEIDNGIHYTQLNDIWDLIFQVSKYLNVQVFATTHSKEMIESYVRVAEKLKDNDVSFIELGKNKDNHIDSVVMNLEQLSKHLKMGNGVRGW